MGRGDANVRQGVVEADAWLERGEARPGSVVRYAVRLKLDDGWHVNGPDVPAGRVATSLALAEKAPVNLGPVRWPDAVEVVPGAPRGFAGTVWIRGEVHVPPGAVPGPRRVSLLLTLQPCEATSCRAADEVRLDLALRFGDADAPAAAPGGVPAVRARVAVPRASRYRSSAANGAAGASLVEVTTRTLGGFKVEARGATASLRLDEPKENGGEATGTTPSETLLAALSGCAAMTLMSYAKRKQWPLANVVVRATLERPPAGSTAPQKIVQTFTLKGALDDEQRKRLLEIAGKCPVHSTLEGPLVLEERLA